jgi:hypothetical protein
MKNGFTSYVIRKIHIKTMMGGFYPSIKPKSRILPVPNAGKDVDQQEFSFLTGGNAK